MLHRVNETGRVSHLSAPSHITLTRPLDDDPMLHAHVCTVGPRPPCMARTVVTARGVLRAVHTWLTAVAAEEAVMALAERRDEGVVTDAVAVTIWSARAVRLLTAQALPARVTCAHMAGWLTPTCSNTQHAPWTPSLWDPKLRCGEKFDVKLGIADCSWHWKTWLVVILVAK